jgi:hypothetical protein
MDRQGRWSRERRHRVKVCPRKDHARLLHSTTARQSVNPNRQTPVDRRYERAPHASGCLGKSFGDRAYACCTRARCRSRATLHRRLRRHGNCITMPCRARGARMPPRPARAHRPCVDTAGHTSGADDVRRIEFRGAAGRAVRAARTGSTRIGDDAGASGRCVQGGSWRSQPAARRAGAGRSADPGQSCYGGFSGEGGARRQPKGYVRSDASLRDGVCERLAQLPHVDVSEVSVDVRDGKVTLSGTVPRRDMKHAIEDCVDSVLGVRDIENHIRVPRP